MKKKALMVILAGMAVFLLLIVVKSSVAVVKSGDATEPQVSFNRSIVLGNHRYGGLTAGDLNKDGEPDLAVLWENTNRASSFDLFFGTGLEGFSGPVSSGIISNCYGDGANTADFNGDGNPDLVFAFGGSWGGCGGYYGTVHLGNGTGYFGSGQCFYGGNSVWYVRTGDFNRDGKIDLVTDDDGGIYINWGKGDGTFAGGTYLHRGYDVADIAVCDFDNNGTLDIVHTCSSPDVIRAYSGNGFGGFSMTADISMPAVPRSIAAGDFNGDGKSDLAVSLYEPGYVILLLGNGLGGFSLQPSVSTVEGHAAILVAADFNGDGYLDTAVSNWSESIPRVSILLGDGSGNLSIPIVFSFEPGTSYVRGLITSDLNNDGLPDLAVSNSQGVRVLFNTTETNQPPIAEAGPDKTALVKEAVQFDGGSSNDPDGYIAAYAWDFGDGSPTATGIQVTHTYAQPGQFTVTLTVTDEEGATAVDQLQATVKAPTAVVNDLIAEVKSSVAGDVQISLASKLDSAFDALNKKNDTAAVNKLKAFINEVEAQKGKKIPAGVAEQWITLTNRIIASIQA